jgi:16S rRNA (adenine(1408)-N(1))-methyltransferase
LPRSEEGVVIDVGTGDGTFVYQSARNNPGTFYLGIDANAGPLAKISEKIHRKPTKGGVDNLLFVQASVENLPEELDGVANVVHIHFPWGSLLRGVATGDELVLRNLRRVCADRAMLEVLIGLDPDRDLAEIARLKLPPLTTEYVTDELVPKYRAAGFEIVERGTITPLNWPEFASSWARRLRNSSERNLIYLIARAEVERSPGVFF